MAKLPQRRPTCSSEETKLAMAEEAKAADRLVLILSNDAEGAAPTAPLRLELSPAQRTRLLERFEYFRAMLEGEYVESSQQEIFLRYVALVVPAVVDHAPPRLTSRVRPQCRAPATSSFTQLQWASFLTTMTEPDPVAAQPPVGEGAMLAFVELVDLYQVSHTCIYPLL
jgi:hypothetical protein